jgi:hypothetical protein
MHSIYSFCNSNTDVALEEHQWYFPQSWTVMCLLLFNSSWVNMVHFKICCHLLNIQYNNVEENEKSANGTGQSMC